MNRDNTSPNNSGLRDKITRHFNSLNFSIPHQDGQEAVSDALNSTVLEGGKRIRPYLTYLFCELCGVKDTAGKNTLSECIEFVHAASLSHDDVIDRASTRRGKDSINVVIGNKKSILAGDYLLSEVIQRLCLLENLEVLNEMSGVIKDLSIGEWVQHGLLVDRNYDYQSLVKVSKLKTSSVLSWCITSPMLYLNFESSLIEKGRMIGNYLGISFQMIDDVLDFKSSSNKDLLLDLKNNQLNFVTFHYLNNHDKLEAFKAGSDLTDLIDIKDITPSLEFVESEAFDYLKKTKALLSSLCEDLSIPKTSVVKYAIFALVAQLEKRLN